MRRLVNKLSYANVVASIALFVSLGGASYAAVTLPANSVGAKQLQPDAVGLGNLRFPLGTVGFTNNTSRELASTCEPPGIAPPIKPRRGGTTPGREVAVVIPRPGSLVISAIVGLADESTVQTPVPVALELVVDRRRVVVNEVTVTGEQRSQVPIQAVKKVLPGKHTVGLAVEAENCLKGTGHVRLTHVSLIASALPSEVTPK
jgi:hypothetical protein